MALTLSVMPARQTSPSKIMKQTCGWMDGNSLYFLSPFSANCNISSMFVKGVGGVILVSKGEGNLML